ncbi:MAG TPA: nucleotidyltransferase [Methylomirabilota bacterium]|nr:nucleotidyltransferase [Methylomirabilota bacterium]
MSSIERQTDRMEEALLRATTALSDAAVPHALMGGLASTAVGRVRHTHDVDLFVTPEDAERALEVLAAAGFATERTDPTWLYKAFWDGHLVDVIFVSKGGVVFDDEMRAHRRRIVVRGRPIEMLSVEDMLVIKAMTNAEHAPRHWHDGLALISFGPLDWPYLVRRARPYASRVLSLLLYALSDGAQVPSEPMRELFEAAMRGLPPEPQTEAEHHLAARVHAALATDPRTSDPHVSVVAAGGEVVVSGRVATPERREAIDAVLREMVGGGRVRNEVEVLAG